MFMQTPTGTRVYGPVDLVCESCHRSNFILRVVEFSDGERFRVCDDCANIACSLGLQVLA